jgi:hypothetical protein
VYIHTFLNFGVYGQVRDTAAFFTGKFIETYVLSRITFAIMLRLVDGYLVNNNLEGVVLILADYMYAMLGPENGGSNHIRRVRNCLPINTAECPSTLDSV